MQASQWISEALTHSLPSHHMLQEDGSEPHLGQTERKSCRQGAQLVEHF